MEWLFQTLTGGVTSPESYFICLAAALGCGILVAAASAFRSRASRSFTVALILLPMIIYMVITMVNGNIGAGVAVAGAFSLVRFRSVPGNAKEIVALFLAMSAGLITGMGYIGFAFLFTIILCAVLMLYSTFDFSTGNIKPVFRICVLGIVHWFIYF